MLFCTLPACAAELNWRCTPLLLVPLLNAGMRRDAR